MDKGQAINKAKAFFTFDLMVLPWLIKIFFVLGLVVLLLVALAYPFLMAFAGGQFQFGGCLVGILASLLTLVFGSIAWRLYCEVLIVLFKIHEGIQSLRKPDPPAQPQ
ncbi:MAG: DUF4282 domain-containing protein [Planctomycetes bacterium]|nr:DUF4282 domain-containing protein [Planctomycetota bacterium]